LKKLFWVNLSFILLFSCVSNKEEIDIVLEYYNIGNAFYELDQFDKAEDYYLRVLKIDPDFHKARNNLVYIYVKKLQFDLAKENIQYLKNSDSENIVVKKLDAYVKYKEGNLKDSLNLYLEIYNGGDKSKSVAISIVKLYYQLNEFTKGLSLIETLIFDSEDSNLFFIAALLAEGAGNIEKAITYYENAIISGNKEEDIFTNLLALYKESKDYINQVRVLELIIKDFSGELKYNSLFLLSKIYFLENNDFSKGYSYLDKAITEGFNNKEEAEDLLKQPDLIEVDKIRQLFKENRILD